jgi:hypothetical protein
MVREEVRIFADTYSMRQQLFTLVASRKIEAANFVDSNDRYNHPPWLKYGPEEVTRQYTQVVANVRNSQRPS